MRGEFTTATATSLPGGRARARVCERMVQPPTPIEWRSLSHRPARTRPPRVVTLLASRGHDTSRVSRDTRDTRDLRSRLAPRAPDTKPAPQSFPTHFAQSTAARKKDLMTERDVAAHDDREEHHAEEREEAPAVARCARDRLGEDRERRVEAEALSMTTTRMMV